MKPAILIVVPGLEREQLYLARALESEGCLVFAAASTASALIIMERIAINLVLVSQDKVEVDELAEAAWRVNPATHFLIVGGGERAATGWSDGYVQRPITAALLLERALNLLSAAFVMTARTISP